MFRMLGLVLALSIFLGAVIAQAKDITPIDDVRRGTPVVIQGEVVRILDVDEFRIQDDTGSIRVYIGWRNRMPVKVGDRVTVDGFVDDDGLRPEVYAWSLTTADGKKIEFKGY